MSDDQHVIDREASAWLIRTEERRLDPEEQRAFDLWRTTNPRHVETLEAMRRTWADITGMGHLAELVPLPETEPVKPPRPPVRRRIYALTGAAMAAAAAFGVFLLVPADAPSAGQPYVTKIAEVRNVTLPDGSTVTLGPKSSIRVRYSDAERRVELAGGEAFFDVVHGRRPFLVDAGSSVVQDLGTRFDVNRTDSSVRVSVLEGAVQVTRTDVSDAAAPRLLKAGQRTEVVLVGSSPSAITTFPANPSAASAPSDSLPALIAQAPGAWREGRLVYDNVRLADLAADVNRYYAPGVSLASPEVGNMRITAAFRTGEIPAFMNMIGDILPVRTNRTVDGAILVSAAQH